MAVNKGEDVFEVLYQELKAWPVPPKNEFERILTDTLALSGEVRKFTGHEVAVARLFYGLLVACPEVYGCRIGGVAGTTDNLRPQQGIPDRVGQALVTLFDNIANVLNDRCAEGMGALTLEQGESFLRIMSLLKSLREQTRGEGFLFSGNRGLEDVPSSLLGMLADIDFIFDIKEMGNAAFPIHTVLEDFIKKIADRGMASRFQDKDVRLLQLAVRLFRDGEAHELIDELKNKCNLRFIDYLRPGCEVVDTREFDNYRTNNVMVFWNSVDHTVLVRTEDESYFDIPGFGLSMGEHCHEGVQREKNAGGSELFFFAVWDWGEGARPAKVDEIVDKEDGAETLLRLLFDGDARNILVNRSLIVLPDGRVRSINPWCPNDNYIVLPTRRGGAKLFFRDRVTEAFDSYRVLPVRRSRVTPLNYVTLGLCMRLLETDNVAVDDLGFRSLAETGWYQAQIVSNWMARGHTTDVTERLLKEWWNQIDYRSTQGKSSAKFSNKKFQVVDFLPVRHSLASLYVALVPGLVRDPSIASDLRLYKGTWVEDDDETCLRVNDVLSLDKEERNRCPMTKVPRSVVSDDNGYLGDVQDGDEVFLLYSTSRDNGFVVSPSLSKRVWDIGLVDSDKYSLDFEVARKVDEVRHKGVQKRTELFSKAFIENASGCHVKGSGLEMILNLRLFHNMLWAQVTKESVDDYLNVICLHAILDFPDFASDEVIWESGEGVLLVPKDGRRAVSTLRELIDESRPSASRYHDLYECDHLTNEESGGNARAYCIQGQAHPVSKIVLVTDNILSGRSTSNALVAYFGEDGRYEPSDDKERGLIEAAKARALRYRNSQGENVCLLDVMKANGIRKVGVHAYYATKEGVDAVARRLEQLGLGGRDGITWRETIDKQDLDPLRDSVNAVWPERKKFPPYPVIRKFNMPSCSVFSGEMLSNPERFICLFIRKGEIVRR